MKNSIILKTINDLSKFSFFIPSYQRGYRWTYQEVTELLNDINEFRPREIDEKEDKTWYCLQPVVVRKFDDLEKYEVIDGQQRLTTLYLILHYLNLDYVEARRDKLFTIDYQTRENCAEFLKTPEQENNENIDFHHISSAYKAIDEWFLAREDEFDKNSFRSKLKFNAKVIWYETTESDPISVFTRLNIGKISLTNSELIKALFLNSSNYHVKDKERLRLRQIEIANEWDGIESHLQNNKLWYFLSDKQTKDNRIEFIFSLMNSSRTINSDSYSTFRYFNDRLSNKTESEVKENWEEVQSYYQRFNEWFNDRTLYHKIGFILNSQISNIKSLYENSSTMKKKEFLLYLDNIIKEFYHKETLLELDYDDKNVTSVLLLYNILTMLQNDHDSSYFPFDTFKLKKWNKEHIASIKDSIPKINRDLWLSDITAFLEPNQKESKTILKEIQQITTQNKYENDDDFIPLFNKVIEHFNQYLSDGDVNTISNLALLDEYTNKSYKNAVFPLKRKRIIELDKSGEFVPLCTKNTFLKYFADYPPKISFWSQDDRDMYEQDLIKVLSNYLEVEK